MTKAARPTRSPRALALALGTGLALATLAPAAQAFDITRMSPEESTAFGNEVRSYLMKNPQVLMEVIGELENQQAANQAQGDSQLIAANSKELFEDGYSYVGGNPKGDITVVEFLDYRCGYCRKAHSEVEELVKSDGNIRYIVKEFPILGPDSVTASRFAIATLKVAGPEAYAKLNDAFYTSYKGPITPEALAGLGSSLGYDGKAVVAAMNSPEVDKILDANHALAQRMQIQGTPSFVMGDQMLRGYVPLDGMRKVVGQARS